MYIGTRTRGRRNKPGANMSIKITATTEPNIKPNHRTKPPIMSNVTTIFQNSLNGKSTIFSNVFILVDRLLKISEHSQRQTNNDAILDWLKTAKLLL